MGSRFENEGVAGLVDGRLRKPATGTSRADPRVVEAIAKVAGSRTDEPTVSAQVLRRRVERLLVAEHGAGAVRMPSRATFYRLLEAVSTGQHLFGSARTRRSLDKQPKRTISLLKREEVDEAELDRVRAVYRLMWADYRARRPAMATIGAGEFASYFAEPDTMEGRAIEAVDAFVSTLAGELGLIEAASHAAETARLRLAR
ncbi:hypothetical protein ACFYZJ_32625 [Streptomyces sp. NPDC001848]|uniref:hypothetical protein n=1 Tax=Streptomyces sp. NPDC001848 TaxID=3364618 RepID=UPI00368598F7